MSKFDLAIIDFGNEDVYETKHSPPSYNGDVMFSLPLITRTFVQWLSQKWKIWRRGFHVQVLEEGVSLHQQCGVRV